MGEGEANSVSLDSSSLPATTQASHSILWAAAAHVESGVQASDPESRAMGRVSS
jgi:hypothetical protein